MGRRSGEHAPGPTVNEPVMRTLLARALGFKDGGGTMPLREWLGALDEAGRCSLPLRGLRFVPERLKVLASVWQGDMNTRLGMLVEDSEGMTLLVSDPLIPGAGGLFFVQEMKSCEEVSGWLRRQSRGGLTASQTAGNQWLVAAPVQCFIKHD